MSNFTERFSKYRRWLFIPRSRNKNFDEDHECHQEIKTIYGT